MEQRGFRLIHSREIVSILIQPPFSGNAGSGDSLLSRSRPLTPAAVAMVMYSR